MKKLKDFKSDSDRKIGPEIKKAVGKLWPKTVWSKGNLMIKMGKIA